MAVSRIILGLVLLAALGAWANYSCPYPDLGEILGNPQKFAGRRVAFFIEAKVAERTEDGFILTQRGHHLRVRATAEKVPIGEFVAVQGVFQPPDRLHAEAVRFAHGRRWKMAVSVIPILLLAVLLPMAVGFDRRRRILILQQKGSHNEKSL